MLSSHAHSQQTYSQHTHQIFPLEDDGITQPSLSTLTHQMIQNLLPQTGGRWWHYTPDLGPFGSHSTVWGGGVKVHARSGWIHKYTFIGTCNNDFETWFHCSLISWKRSFSLSHEKAVYLYMATSSNDDISRLLHVKLIQQLYMRNTQPCVSSISYSYREKKCCFFWKWIAVWKWG